MNINVEPYEEVDIQVGKVEEKNEKSKLQMFQFISFRKTFASVT